MNSQKFEIRRKRNFINKIINKYSLNLQGLTLFTEAASGNYMYTALIAASAGAKRVYAIASDSKYGNKEEIKEQIRIESEELGLGNIIKVVYEKNKNDLQKCDIITNSGFVRPINREMISNLKSTAVISLMWETWELRPEELDLEACKEFGILVMGTNEHHPSLNLFRTIGFKTCKLLFDNGFSVYEDRYLLISSGDYGKSIADFFNNNMIKYDRITCDNNGVRTGKDFLNSIEEYDAVIVAELNHNVEIIGDKGFISGSRIKDENPLMKVLYICGVVDKENVVFNEVEMFPQTTSAFGHISITADYLGWRPVLELNTAGLKVGEAMANGKRFGLSHSETIAYTLENSPADSF